MQSRNKSEVLELLQKKDTQPFLMCCICGDNFLSYKREFGLRKGDGKKYQKIPVVGFIIEAYHEDPIYQDSVVESNLCTQKCHLTCMVRYAKRVYKNEIENPSLLDMHPGRKWKCPSQGCNAWHADATTLNVRDRKDYDVGFYKDSTSIEVVVQRKSYNKLILSMRLPPFHS